MRHIQLFDVIEIYVKYMSDIAHFCKENTCKVYFNYTPFGENIFSTLLTYVEMKCSGFPIINGLIYIKIIAWEISEGPEFQFPDLTDTRALVVHFSKCYLFFCSSIFASFSGTAREFEKSGKGKSPYFGRNYTASWVILESRRFSFSFSPFLLFSFVLGVTFILF